MSNLDDLQRTLKAVVKSCLDQFRYCNPVPIDGLEDTEDEEEDYFVSNLGNDRDAASTSNYYKTEVKKVEKASMKLTTTFDDEEMTLDSDDAHSSMTEHVLNHRSYVKPESCKTTMCSTRAAMEGIAFRSQKQQALKVNHARVQDRKYKQTLDIGDIGVIYVKPKTRNTCDHPYLPVMVTGTLISSKFRGVNYSLCCQYGPLRGTFAREDIRYEQHLTPEIVRIDPSKRNFDAIQLTVEEASAKHNVLGGKFFCRCKKDCALVPKCSCIALGRLCRDKCHGGKNDIKCSNCHHTQHAGHSR